MNKSWLKTCWSCFCPPESHDESGCSDCRCDIAKDGDGFFDKPVSRKCNSCIHVRKILLNEDATLFRCGATPEGVGDVKDFKSGDTILMCANGYWGGVTDTFPEGNFTSRGRPRASFLETQATDCYDFTARKGHDIPATPIVPAKARADHKRCNPGSRGVPFSVVYADDSGARDNWKSSASWDEFLDSIMGEE